MHAAGYALDPEFMSTAPDMNEATQSGLIAIIEKVSLRDEMAAAKTTAEADALTFDSDKVAAGAHRLDHDRAGDLPAGRGRLHQAVHPLVRQDHGTCHLVVDLR